MPLPDSVQQLRYSLCRTAFDANHGAWGDRVDTLWNARLEKGSVCHPKASPDGRYLLYTFADYGTFPSWHRDTELQLMDLQTGAIDSLPMVNSSLSDTYHSWSAGSRWFAFASKRGDGQYGRVYFAYLDAEGKAHKPFVLPLSLIHISLYTHAYRIHPFIPHKEIQRRHIVGNGYILIFRIEHQ